MTGVLIYENGINEPIYNIWCSRFSPNIPLIKSVCLIGSWGSCTNTAAAASTVSLASCIGHVTLASSALVSFPLPFLLSPLADLPPFFLSPPSFGFHLPRSLLFFSSSSSSFLTPGGCFMLAMLVFFFFFYVPLALPCYSSVCRFLHHYHPIHINVQGHILYIQHTYS